MPNVTKIVAVAAIFLASYAYAAEEDIQYETLTVEKAKCDVGILYKETETGMELKVAAVATGKGADFRKWEVTGIKLDAGGEMVKPSSSEKSWGGEASFFRLPAAFIFAAIGTQYERYGSECSSGQTCPVTGQTTGADAHPGYKGSAARAIDKAGMAAGMGLITSQAKGEIPILKCSFLLDRDLIAKYLAGKLKVKLNFENKNRNDIKKAEVDITKQFSDFVKKHPGVEHKGGVPTGGTFIVVTEGGKSGLSGGTAEPAGTTKAVVVGGRKYKTVPGGRFVGGEIVPEYEHIPEEEGSAGKGKKALQPLKEGMAASDPGMPAPSGEGAPVPSEAPGDGNPMLKKNQDDYLRHSKRLKEIDPDSEEAKAIRRALPKFEKEIKEMGGEVPVIK